MARSEPPKTDCIIEYTLEKRPTSNNQRFLLLEAVQTENRPESVGRVSRRRNPTAPAGP